MAGVYQHGQLIMAGSLYVVPDSEMTHSGQLYAPTAKDAVDAIEERYAPVTDGIWVRRCRHQPQKDTVLWAYKCLPTKNADIEPDVYVDETSLTEEEKKIKELLESQRNKVVPNNCSANVIVDGNMVILCSTEKMQERN